MLDNATRERFPIVSGMSQVSVFGLLLLILYTNAKLIIHANADDSTLLAADLKPTDRPAVTASLLQGLG